MLGDSNPFLIAPYLCTQHDKVDVALLVMSHWSARIGEDGLTDYIVKWLAWNWA